MSVRPEAVKVNSMRMTATSQDERAYELTTTCPHCGSTHKTRHFGELGEQAFIVCPDRAGDNGDLFYFVTLEGE